MSAFVSATNGEDGSGSGVTTIATSSPMNVAAGNLLVAGVKHGSTITGITDGGLNNFTYAGTSTNTTTGWKIDFWYMLSAIANATATFTATTGSSGNFPAIVVMQFSGLVSLDVTNMTGQADLSTTVTSGSFTPTLTAEVIVAFSLDTGNGSTWTPDTGYSTDAGAVSGTIHQVYGQYKASPISASAQTVTATNDFGQYKAIAVATFQEPSATLTAFIGEPQTGSSKIQGGLR